MRTKRTGTAASQAYAKRAASISALIRQLTVALKAHAKRAGICPADWGFAGDLAEVEGKIRETLSFLNGISSRADERELQSLAANGAQSGRSTKRMSSAMREDMQRFKATIDRRRRDAEQAKKAGDLDIAETYKKDVADLRCIFGLINGGLLAQAAALSNRLDTAVRDDIPVV